MLGWKVVKPFGGDIFLSIFSPEPIQYSLNVPTFPLERRGPLGIFRTRKAARAFRKLREEGRVLKCKYEPSKETYFYCFITHNPSLPSDLCTNYGIHGFPEDTVLANSVTLLRSKG